MITQAEKMIQTPETLQVAGIKSPNTLKRLIDEEGFPQPYEIMRGRKSWAMSEVQNWLHKRMQEQRAHRSGKEANLSAIHDRLKPAIRKGSCEREEINDG